MLQHHFVRTDINVTNGITQAHASYSHSQFYRVPSRDLAYVMDELNEANLSFQLGECPYLTKEELDLYDRVVALNKSLE